MVVNQETLTWLAQYQPADSFRGHFEFFSHLFVCWTQPRWWLDVPGTASKIGYADAIDAGQYLTTLRSGRVRRWRVDDNLPGRRSSVLVPEAERGWLHDLTTGVQGWTKPTVQGGSFAALPS